MGKIMNEKYEPIATVCIPVYNCETYIGQAIESVLAQSFTNLELIILNDASTDGTLGVIRSYTDPRVRVFNNDTNLGVEGNWNKALGEARGKYVKLLPQDDYLHPDCLEWQIATLERPENRSVVLVSCGRDIVDSTGKKLIERHFPGTERRIPGQKAIQMALKSGTNPLGEPGAILFKRDVLQFTGVFDGSLAYVIDVDLWLRMLLFGDLYVTHHPHCAFRLSAGSSSVKLSSIQSQQFIHFIQKLSADSRFKVGFVTRYRGILMSILLGQARRLFYTLTVQNRK